MILVWIRFLNNQAPYADRLDALLDRGVGWIDAHLLASAIVERLQLWTADSNFAAVAADLGIAWENS